MFREKKGITCLLFNDTVYMLKEKEEVLFSFFLLESRRTETLSPSKQVALLSRQHQELLSLKNISL